MGLDLYLMLRVDRDEGGHAGCSYGGFSHFRERLCESAGLGNINDYKGFGGKKEWPSLEDEPLVSLLNHSDCDGELWGWECEGLAARIRSVVLKAAWSEGEFDREYALNLADMFDRAENDGGVVAFR